KRCACLEPAASFIGGAQHPSHLCTREKIITKSRERPHLKIRQSGVDRGPCRAIVCGMKYPTAVCAGVEIRTGSSKCCYIRATRTTGWNPLCRCLAPAGDQNEERSQNTG